MAAVGSIPPQVYSPREDTFLMVDAITTLSVEGKSVLDLGTGSGVLGLYCALRRADVTAADIDDLAIRHLADAARLLGVELKLKISDLFSNIPSQFDLVLFNPPYLPSEGIHDRTVDGGDGGRDLIIRFLEELPHHLRRDGTAFLLLSSLNSPGTLRKSYNNFEFSTIAKQAIFFEELEVLRVRLRNDLSI
ncbi:MAG: HemK2/MTQ2 family protein methyltransferase [Candidatus Bathyarchaeia archaeon]